MAARGAARWRETPASERAAALVRAAAWLRERRLELAALEVRECAKPWPEADADVCEAIDFLEYYARAAIELGHGRQLLQVPGEHNELSYAPLGIVAVISPWNFPLAIPCGMTSAALAAGNAVVLKPAEQSPATAYRLVQALRAGGVPPEAISLLPGEGDVGEALVRDPRVHAIAFTGSLPVGRSIVRTAAETSERHFKRVVAELGGKNCVIVTADADLDEAVPAILQSAFAFAGQKCSAASRVLVDRRVADHLCERLAGAAGVLLVGQADSLETDVPPVIEREAMERVTRYRELASQTGTVIAEAPVPHAADGWFCPATVVADLPDDSPVLGRGDLRAAAGRPARRRSRTRLRHRRRPLVRAHRRAVLPRPARRATRARADAGRQPVRQPRHHRRDGRASAVRRQPSVGYRPESRRTRLSAPVRRATGGLGEHDAPRDGRVALPPGRSSSLTARCRCPRPCDASPPTACATIRGCARSRWARA